MLVHVPDTILPIKLFSKLSEKAVKMAIGTYAGVLNIKSEKKIKDRKTTY